MVPGSIPLDFSEVGYKGTKDATVHVLAVQKQENGESAQGHGGDFFNTVHPVWVLLSLYTKKFCIYPSYIYSPITNMQCSR